MPTPEDKDPPPPGAGPAEGAVEPATATVATEEPAPAPEPEPEPWTPERVLDWNRYYDVYVVAAVVLLVFLGSAHKIVNAGLWTQLQAGRLTAAQGWPATRDPFSYTELGQPWVNIPWGFGLIHALTHDFGYNLIYDQ